MELTKRRFHFPVTGERPGEDVMPKLRNLPMTTRDPVSDAKAREFLLPSSSWAPTLTVAAAKERSPELWVTLLIYVGYSRAKNLKNGSFRVGRRLIGYLLWKG